MCEASIMNACKELSEKVETLQNLLISYSTGGQVTDAEYKQLRTELLADPTIRDQLPRFVRTCRDLRQFWQFIQPKFRTYRERRTYLWGEFTPILDSLESESGITSPFDEGVTEVLTIIDSDAVHVAWRRALERRLDDPDVAITAARSLIESVCKHILDSASIVYSNEATLPQLCRLTAMTLNVAPDQHSERVVKQILGGATTVVEGLGALRNILGDAHGKSMTSARPELRHAELAVNLAGAIATFLIATWEIKLST
jgi:hypothetical protein